MRLRYGLLAVWCAGAALCHAEPPASPPTEEEVKAAVVFNILQFVKWPAGALAPGQPVVLCASEASGVGKSLARYGGTRLLHDGLVAYKVLNRRFDGLESCHAVFVPAGSPYAVLQVSAASQEKPILVVAEGNALQQGAGMAVTLVGSHVAIDVDLVATNAAGLIVSSKLLRLARTVIK